MGLYEFWDFATKIASVDVLKETSKGNQPTDKQQAVKTAVCSTFLTLDHTNVNIPYVVHIERFAFSAFLIVMGFYQLHLQINLKITDYYRTFYSDFSSL